MRQITLGADLTVFGLNPDETRFMYREIFEDRCYLQHGLTLEDGDCVFDVGANIGMATLFFHRERRPIRIFAFEPNPAVAECLRANIAMHGVDARVFAIGLMGASRTEEFTLYPSNSAASGFHADAARDRAATERYLVNTGVSPHGAEVFAAALFRKQEKFSCPVRTLSEVVDEEGVERIDLLKIDAERSERDVIAGIREDHWGRIRQIVMELTDEDGSLHEVEAMLGDRGFKVIAKQEPLLRGTPIYNLFASKRAGSIAD
ncbi:MAG TPA: FkbM family methyltransferase [Acidobacteriaceae bacterium]|nr:FkbM family methyltransferase [Acidobacteriaceae bacterium]